MSSIDQNWRPAQNTVPANDRVDQTALTYSTILTAGMIVAAVLAALAPAAYFTHLGPAWLGAIMLMMAGLLLLQPKVRFREVPIKTDETLVSPRLTEIGDEHGYEALRDVVGQLVMHHDSSGKVRLASCESRRLFELEPNDFVGAGFFNRIHVADRPSFLQTMNAAGRGDGVFVTRLRLRSGHAATGPSGMAEPHFDWAEIRVKRIAQQPVADGDGRAECFISVTDNINDLKENERKFGLARAEADMAVLLKDRLLANVSHELRTPLNAILGFSEILGTPELAPSEPAKRIEYARIIHSSAEHLLSVVNLVLDMSKIEAGKFEIAPEPFDLEALIKDCADMIRLKAENGQVNLVRKDCESQIELIADKRACRQIILNIISNAVKFTPPKGTVTIETDIVGSMLLLKISDTGIGIAAEDLPRLGDPFFQVRSNYDRSFEGAGLGLSLVRGLVGLHGGTLSLASAPNVGTQVTVGLPLDCRAASSKGVGAPRLETCVLIPLASRNPNHSEATNNIECSEERKIA